MENVVDEKSMSFWYVLKKVEFYFIKNVLPDCHIIIDWSTDMGVKVFITIYKVSIYLYINVIDRYLIYQKINLHLNFYQVNKLFTLLDPKQVLKKHVFFNLYSH